MRKMMATICVVFVCGVAIFQYFIAERLPERIIYLVYAAIIVLFLVISAFLKKK